MKNGIYSFSSGFRDGCAEAVARIRAKVSDAIELCKVITLQDYGGVVVRRLDLNETAGSLDALSALKCEVRKQAGPDYWMNFIALPPSPIYEGLLEVYVRSCDRGVGLGKYLIVSQKLGIT